MPEDTSRGTDSSNLNTLALPTFLTSRISATACKGEILKREGARVNVTNGTYPQYTEYEVHRTSPCFVNLTVPRILELVLVPGSDEASSSLDEPLKETTGSS
jgi:hypothetical protein